MALDIAYPTVIQRLFQKSSQDACHIFGCATTIDWPQRWHFFYANTEALQHFSRRIDFVDPMYPPPQISSHVQFGAYCLDAFYQPERISPTTCRRILQYDRQTL